MPEITLRTGEKTHQAVLPQRSALEPASADNPGVGTKRGAGVRSDGRATGVQHGRGETGSGFTCPSRRHPHPAGEPAGSEPAGPAARTEAVPPKSVAGRVFVLDRHGKPLNPCHPARARQLLVTGRAMVAHRAPFVIRLKDRESSGSQTASIALKFDPGSRHTGIALARVADDGTLYGLVAVEVGHRGERIHKAMVTRAALRRSRRSRKLRYRSPRFNNRRRPEGWLPPSIRHRVESTLAIVNRLRRWAPVSAIEMELARFDTQALQNPGISGVAYQQGTLAGYEVREYLLEKWGRRCVYCDANDVPLNIDHIRPRAKGGTNRISNLVLACVACNQNKSVRLIGEFLASDLTRLKRILAHAKAPLKDAAAVNVSRWALYRGLQATGLLVGVSTGGRTKWNRTRASLPKTHTLDALCVGPADHVACYPVEIIVADATGRGTRQRVNPDRYGFARAHKPRTKSVNGYFTGDLVVAASVKGKEARAHVGRVAVRTRGVFSIRTTRGLVRDVNSRSCTLLQRGDGWRWTWRREGDLDVV